MAHEQRSAEREARRQGGVGDGAGDGAGDGGTGKTRSWQPVTLGEGYPPPRGAYSPATRAGDFVFVSGQVPRDPRTGEHVGGDVAAQARRTLDNLRLALEAAGASLDDLVSVTVYLANEDDWGAFNDVYKATLRPPYPARAVVGAGLRDVLVEISAVAHVGGARAARGAGAP